MKGDIPCSYDRLQDSEGAAATNEQHDIASTLNVETSDGGAVSQGQYRRRYSITTNSPLEYGSTAPLRDYLNPDRSTAGVNFRKLPHIFATPKRASISMLKGAIIDSEAERQNGLASVHVDHHDITSLGIESADSKHDEILQGRLNELVVNLTFSEQSILRRTGRSAGCSEDAVRTLFTTANFNKAIDAVFRRAYPHFPLVHRPTFDANTCTLPLLLTIFLAGCIYTCPNDLYSSAIGIDCINLSEEYVFSDQSFQSMMCSRCVDLPSQRQTHLETIIAAVVVTYLQLGSADADTRRRMHHQRLPAVFEAARSVNLFGSVHSTAVVTQSDYDWRKWVEDEMAIR